MAHAQVLVGDCLSVLGTLQAGLFHACMTSPPYWALRDYGTGTWEGGDAACDHVAPPTGGKTGSTLDGAKQRDGHSADGKYRDVCGKCGARRVDKQIGSEATPEEYVENMVAVFRGVRRVLRDDGFLWVNMGDSYDAGTSGGRKPTQTGKHGYWENENIDKRVRTALGAGQQLLMPHRLAMAMQADGWRLRDTVAWVKRSPMPSSQNGVRWSRCMVKVKGQGKSSSAGQHYPPSAGHPERSRNPDSSRDPELKAKYAPCPGCAKCSPNGGYVLRRGSGRCTTAFEYVFLFAKNGRYFWDMENCREGCSTNTHSKGSNRHHKDGVVGRERSNSSFNDAISGPVQSRIPRNVWTLSSEPTKYKHFATFPSELVRRCLLPLSPRGCCPECGAQWAPVVESERVATRPGVDSKATDWYACPHEDSPLRTHSGDVCGNRDPERHVTQTRVVEYRPTCACPAHDPVGCRVLDPFSGTGTTGQTACFLGHDYVGIELNPEYAAFSEEWIAKTPRWKLRERSAKSRLRGRLMQPALF